MKKFTAIGIMSGTSLDGVDIACCEFYEKDNGWKYKIIEAETINYSPGWHKKLDQARELSGLDLSLLNIAYGKYLGEIAHNFIQKYHIKPHLIASHGHTVFHQPHKGITLQIGCGAEIAAETGCTVVSDFRTLDVAHGGQGAPLVPAGDRLLFSEYFFALNLGGFANISFDDQLHRVAFDVCPANIALNYLSSKMNLKYDEGGKIAATGRINNSLLTDLNDLSYYRSKYPKSLGYEWLKENFLPVIDKCQISVPDKLRTVSEHIAQQIAEATSHHKRKKILITGGGSLNHYLIERITSLCRHEIIIPDLQTIHFKEALIFAFLGVLRIIHSTNCLQSVTGASRDSIGGAVYRG